MSQPFECGTALGKIAWTMRSPFVEYSDLERELEDALDYLYELEEGDDEPTRD